MAGAFYIWIMAAFFIGCVGVMVLISGVMLIGHWLEKKQTGATHGFLELPEELRPKSAPDSKPPDRGSEEGPPAQSAVR